ncbi:PINIT domain-containing protein [Dipodascopsis uninucleata]
MPDDTYARHNEILRYVNQELTMPPLKSVLRTLGLPTNGRKNVLQMRLVGKLNELRANNRVQEYEVAKRSILEQYAVYHASRPSYLQGNRGSSSATAVSAYASQVATGRTASAEPASFSVDGESLKFKPSPFYSLLEQFHYPCICNIQPKGKGSFTMTFRFNLAHIERLRDDPSYRVYLLGAATDDTFRQAAIQFPQHFEVRVNNKPVQANFRGLKNKPGTVKPADITDYTVKDANIRNAVEVTYAFTNYRYTVVLYFARRKTVQQLVTRITSGRRLAKETVIAQITKSNSEDDDIVATSTIMSLKCPLSFSRIQIPIRSIRCSHVQCFDATSYIQLQEQAETWQCPICNIFAPLEDIAIDSYVDDILKNTSKDADSVEIDPTGIWKPPLPSVLDASDDEDSDNDEGTPPADWETNKPVELRESSARSTPSTFRQSNVIDLTLSDEEDEPAATAHTQRATSQPQLSHPQASSQYAEAYAGRSTSHAENPSSYSQPISAVSNSALATSSLPTSLSQQSYLLSPTSSHQQTIPPFFYPQHDYTSSESTSINQRSPSQSVSTPGYSRDHVADFRLTPSNYTQSQPMTSISPDLTEAQSLRINGTTSSEHSLPSLVAVLNAAEDGRQSIESNTLPVVSVTGETEPSSKRHNTGSQFETAAVFPEWASEVHPTSSPAINQGNGLDLDNLNGGQESVNSAAPTGNDDASSDIAVVSAPAASSNRLKRPRESTEKEENVMTRTGSPGIESDYGSLDLENFEFGQ